MAAASRKGLVQDLDVRNQIHLEPSPVGKLPAAHAANLIDQEFDSAFVSAIVMRFDDPRFAQVVQLDQAPLLDRGAQQTVDTDFGWLQRSTSRSGRIQAHAYGQSRLSQLILPATATN